MPRKVTCKARRLERASARAGALDFIRALPHGWDTICAPGYQGGTDLSGGQWHMADQIIVMDGARVAESGDHQTLIDQDGTYAELFALQAAGYRA